MAVPTLITDLSTTPASNSPAGSENVFPNLDDYLRAQSAFLASVRDNSGNGWVSPYLPLAGGTMTGPVSGFTATTGTFSGNVQMPSLNGGALGALRNRLINGGFSVNQRAVSGTVTLAAGAYGHDRWKAGASGCTYTFATVANVTTLTISAGSLIQVVEGINLETGTYCLSWSGTATAKIGAGSLSASGVTGSITGGTNTNIEISTGTVSKVQLELSPIPTTFESTRPYGMELALCQRYYEVSANMLSAWAQSTTAGKISGIFQVPKRVGPSVALYTGATLNAQNPTVTFASGTNSSLGTTTITTYNYPSGSVFGYGVDYANATALTTGIGYIYIFNSQAVGAPIFAFNAEL
jgi:hypothetical protein